jgi:hypothetical protein
LGIGRCNEHPEFTALPWEASHEATYHKHQQNIVFIFVTFQTAISQICLLGVASHAGRPDVRRVIDLLIPILTTNGSVVPNVTPLFRAFLSMDDIILS